MKTFVPRLQALICLFLFQFSLAQTYSLNWQTAFSPVWADGTISRTANNIGGSNINCTISMNKTGGVFTNIYDTYGGAMTPTVSGTVYRAGVSTSNLLIALEYASNTDYTDVTFTFSGVVNNVQFLLADIDRLANTYYNYLDQVIITGKWDLLNVNPTLTKYDNTTDPNFFFISGNMATVNTANGMSGNSMSDAVDQKGTIIVNFGSQFINSFTIRYQNAPGTIANPTVQNIAIGNISFQRAYPVPVKLISFDGVAKDDKVTLNWRTADEVNFNHYAIERSQNGGEFEEIGIVFPESNGHTREYKFEDRKTVPSKYQYRLKMVDKDGTFKYSSVVSINTDKTNSGYSKVYPTIFSSQLSIELNSMGNEQIQVCMLNNMGQVILTKEFKSHPGTNSFIINTDRQIVPGQYYVTIKNNNGLKTHNVIKR